MSGIICVWFHVYAWKLSKRVRCSAAFALLLQDGVARRPRPGSPGQIDEG